LEKKVRGRIPKIGEGAGYLYKKVTSRWGGTRLLEPRSEGGWGGRRISLKIENEIGGDKIFLLAGETKKGRMNHLLLKKKGIKISIPKRESVAQVQGKWEKVVLTSRPAETEWHQNPYKEQKTSPNLRVQEKREKKGGGNEGYKSFISNAKQ